MACIALWTTAAAASFAFCSIGLAQPLPTDGRLVTGELPNGMHYIVRRHSNPPERAAMWIHVSTGSLNETDAQRGISHFLEHMAFNGSENFKPGTVVNFFQSMGLRFGADQNAFTSFDQTTYQLAFPDTKPETLDKGMLFFADVAGRLSLLPSEIESERQVILEEKRTREGGSQRVSDYVIERLIPGSLFGERLPIGINETLLKLSEADFKSYYTQWYVPSNMTVMVVADADPAPIVEQIKKNFSFGAKTAKPVDQDPRVKPYDASRAIVASDAELTKAEIEIVGISAVEPPTTTVELMRRDMVRQIGVAAFNRRIGAKMSKGDTAYLSAGASVRNQPNLALWRQLSSEGKPEDWKKLLSELGTDVQRARLNGFNTSEVDDVKTEIISSLEQYVAQESTMPASAMLRIMNTAIASGEPIMSAQQELDLTRQILPSVTVEEVSLLFKDNFDPSKVTFIASLPSNAEIPTEDQLLALGKAAFDVKPEAEKQIDRPKSLLSELPTAGKAIEVATHESSAVTNGWLDNGIRFHHRFMDIQKERVIVSITLAAGVLQETAETRGIAEVAGLAWGRPATSKLSSTNIRDIRTGKKTNVRGGAGLDTLTLSIAGSPVDLEDGLQLAYLLLTDPLIEPANFDQWKKDTLQAIDERQKNIEAAMGEVVAQTIFPASDPRFQPLNVSQVNKLSIEAAQSWLRNAIATAPIEVAVVGDIQKDQAIELIAKYLGALPRRARIDSTTLDSLRTVTKAPGPHMADKRLATQTEKAVVLTGFYSADADNIYDTRCLSVASQIISTRVLEKIREKEQLAYSPGCRNQPGTAIPGFGMFMGMTDTEPSKTDRLVAAYGEIFDEFSATPATDDELNTARKQFANDLDNQMKQPGFWAGRISTMDYRNIKLDDVLAAPAAYQQFTAAQIKDVFNKYYRRDNTVQVILRPADKSGASVETTK